MSDLIQQLISQGYLKTSEIIEAFQKIKRADFLTDPDQSEEKAEINAPLSIGFGQTISQPLTVAFMLELLQPKPDDKVLDVGSGSGWTTALLAYIVAAKTPHSIFPLKEGGEEHHPLIPSSKRRGEKEGKVYAIERIPELMEFGKKNVSKYNFVYSGVVEFFCTDGTKGLPQYAPFDKIQVAAAATEIPLSLLKQLKTGGRMIIPIGEERWSQDLVVIDKIDKDKYKEKRYPGFVFVPLIEE